jgi:hypothetical protein
VKILHEKDNGKLLEGNSHLSDNIACGKIADMKTQKEANLRVSSGQL